VSAGPRPRALVLVLHGFSPGSNADGLSIYLPMGSTRAQRPAVPCAYARKMNSCLIEFEDGYQMVTSRNAIGKATLRMSE
jgi:hypothetical protein